MNLDDLDAGVKALSDQIKQGQEARIQVAELNAKVAYLEKEVSELESFVKKAQAERDHYMRQCTEYNTLLTSVGLLITDGLEKIAQGVYRPNGHIRQKPEASDDFPSVVRKGPVVDDADFGRTVRMLGRNEL